MSQASVTMAQLNWLTKNSLPMTELPIEILLPVQVAFLAFRQVDHGGSASLVDYFQV